MLGLRETFEQEGYVSRVPILTAEEVRHYRAVYERLEKKAKEQGAVGRLINTHHTDPAIWSLATHPNVLATIRTIIGDDVVLMSTGFFVKQPGSSDQFVAWHQDTMYWGLNPPFALTAWVALDESDAENGCVRVIPRTHRLGLLPHRSSLKPGNILSQDQEIDVVHFDENTAVDFELEAGEASIHHGELVHGSNPNCSTRRRCGMTIRFTRPDIQPKTDGPFPFRDIPILVSGSDRYGHFRYVSAPSFANV